MDFELHNKIIEFNKKIFEIKVQNNAVIAQKQLSQEHLKQLTKKMDNIKWKFFKIGEVNALKGEIQKQQKTLWESVLKENKMQEQLIEILNSEIELLKSKLEK